MPKRKSWKERLDKLPVHLTIITEGGIKSSYCIEGQLRDARYIGSRDWLPSAGVKYHLSFSGSIRGREKLIEQISAELGKPESLDRLRPNLWHYYWPTDSTEIPETKVHETLGRQRIREICQSYGLSSEDERIIDDLLATFSMYLGMLTQRASYAMSLISDFEPERRERITRAFMKINLEFAEKRHPELL